MIQHADFLLCKIHNWLLDYFFSSILWILISGPMVLMFTDFLFSLDSIHADKWILILPVMYNSCIIIAPAFTSVFPQEEMKHYISEY